MIRFCDFDSTKDNDPKGKILAWDVLCARLTRHTVRPATAEGKQSTGPLWSPTVYAPGARRGALGVELVTCFVADIDDGASPADWMQHWVSADGQPLRWAMHSSFSSRTDAPRWRVVFPLSRAVPTSEWPAVWRKLNYTLLGGHCDPATKDPSRIYYWPACPAERMEEAFADVCEGVLLDPDAIPDLPESKPTPKVKTFDGPTPPSVGDLRTRLLDKYVAMAAPGNRNPTAFALAGQLRDNGFSEVDTIAVLEEFKARMGSDFDDDMGHVAAQAFKRAPREPWSSPRAGREIPWRRPETAASDDFMDAAPPRSSSSASSAPHSRAEGPTPRSLEPWTDVGNKDRFLRHFGEVIRFDPTRGWMIWDGKRWTADVDGGQTLGLAERAARALYLEEEPEDEKLRQAWRSFVKSANGLAKMKSAVSLAETDPRVRVYSHVWDSDPWIINCQNGIVDLRTGTLSEHDPSRYCTYVAQASYRPEALAPVWEQCLTTWQPSQARREYLKRHAGYNLTGDTGEQCALFHFGDGGNGKSVYTNVIEHVMGDYATRVPFAVLTDDKPRGGQASPDIARLAGRRLVIGSEIIGGRGFNESLIKDLTGGDVIIARHLHAAPFEFRPSFKLVLYGNHKPTIRNQDEGIWRRLPLVEWGVSIPKEERDPDLLRKLKEETDGVFAWMVAGCLEWQKSGLQTPDEVTQASQSYREEQDQIGKFLKECCVLAEGAWASSKDLRAAYDAWCRENGEKWEASPNQFGDRLRRAGAVGDVLRRVDGKVVRGWGGVGLASDRVDDFELVSPEERNGAVTGKNGAFPSTEGLQDRPSVTGVTAETAKSTYSPHVRTHAHHELYKTDVTGVTGVTGVSEAPPSRRPEDREAREKQLLRDLALAAHAGEVSQINERQDAAWRELVEAAEPLKAQMGAGWATSEAGEPLYKAMLDIARWWASIGTGAQRTMPPRNPPVASSRKGGL